MICVETSYYGVSFLYQYTLYPGGACAQPGCLCIAGAPVHSRGVCAYPGCLCSAEGARALLRSALRHPRLQKIASSRRGNNCYVHLRKTKRDAFDVSFCLLYLFSIPHFYASIVAYVAFSSINSRRGATSSPINIENV